MAQIVAAKTMRRIQLKYARTSSYFSSPLKISSHVGLAFLLAVVLGAAALFQGCSGIVSSNSQPPPPTTYSISGTISPTAGGNGATVTLSGASSATTTANSSGAYTFTGLANGTYTVTPSHSGYTISPASPSVTVSGTNVTGTNFTATAQNTTYNISGTLSPTAGGSGATVTLSGAASATTTANSSGAYTFTGLANGTYAVTPSNSGYTFSPTSQNATINGANVTSINFTASPSTSTFSISGTISPTTGGSVATVTLSGPAAATTTTNGSGAYSFTGLGSGTYTVTPSNSGFSFTPPNQSVTINGANQSSVNFTASATQTHTVALSWIASTSVVTGYNIYRSTTSGSGFVKINSSLVSLLAYTDSSVANSTTYYYVATAVDSNGIESAFSNQVTAIIP